jgi:hypothetical protein
MPRVLVSYVTPKGTISRAEKMWLNGEKKPIAAALEVRSQLSSSTSFHKWVSE